jgi:uncharacterized membrane protein YeaQ/YmgE (transglycosylase-associated protein family)
MAGGEPAMGLIITGSSSASIAGAVAHRVLNSRGGFLGSLVVGLIGALVGGELARLFNLHVTGGMLDRLIVAVHRRDPVSLRVEEAVQVRTRAGTLPHDRQIFRSIAEYARDKINSGTPTPTGRVTSTTRSSRRFWNRGVSIFSYGRMQPC